MSLHDINQRIREDIVAGELPFGARITIDALATRYGVSHMPVRGALRELQGEGLVVIEPNRGARVRTIDANFVENLFEIRTVLEVMMVRRAAQRCTPGDVAELQGIEAVLEKNVGAQDFAAAISDNRRFHQAINRIADNVDALPILDRHWLLLSALWRTHGYAENRFAGVSSDHRHLIAALAAHDQEAAAVLMGAHATKARLELVARIHAKAAPPPPKKRRRA
jgi:DNA-binding GntR family transcriptional regulator